MKMCSVTFVGSLVFVAAAISTIGCGSNTATGGGAGGAPGTGGSTAVTGTGGSTGPAVGTGGSTVVSATGGASGTTQAPGKSAISATFSDPVGGYSGSLAAYASDPTNSTATANPYLAFATSDNNSRALSVQVFIAAPVQGTSYPSSRDPSSLVVIAYQEISPLTAWTCTGSVTFDSISGKEYAFHFTGTCASTNQTAGGVTITGTGTGTLG